MNILNLVLNSISSILNIISDIILIQSKRKEEKTTKDSKTEITCITRETKFIEKKTTNSINN